MSEQGQPKQDAELRAQALAEMGLDDPNDYNWERENPYDYMPYLVSHPKGSAKEIEAALRMRGLCRDPNVSCKVYMLHANEQASLRSKL